MTDSIQLSGIDSVTVLLSTFNGERYLAELLDSILNQSFRDFKLFIRDDGSSDGSLNLLNRYAEEYPNRINLIKDNLGNLGPANSFLQLLKNVPNQSYVMCADQDDVWFLDKILLFLQAIREVEGSSSSRLPMMVFGDMIVTDENLVKVANSYWQYQCVFPSYCSNWMKVLTANPVAGCSSILNFQAVTMLTKYDCFPVLHDLFAAVLVSKFGVLKPMANPTMFYRQHGRNSVGANRFTFLYLVRRAETFFSKSIPAYRKMCRIFSVALSTFFYLKTITTAERLLHRFRKSY